MSAKRILLVLLLAGAVSLFGCTGVYYGGGYGYGTAPYNYTPVYPYAQWGAPTLFYWGLGSYYDAFDADYGWNSYKGHGHSHHGGHGGYKSGFRGSRRGGHSGNRHGGYGGARRGSGRQGGGRDGGR